MNLELSDEQTWLSESVETLLTRYWVDPGAAWEAGANARRKVWQQLAEFGALDIGREEGLGAIELCLVSRALGAHLASVPFLDNAALRYAMEPLAGELPAAFAELGSKSVSVALLEPGRGWAAASIGSALGPADRLLTGRKVAVEHAGWVDGFAVVASVGEETALALVPAAGAAIEPQPALDPTVPLASIGFDEVHVPNSALLTGDAAAVVADRMATVGALLAAADAVGAAGRVLDDACRYAGERRQFGHTIGSNQALRHLLADLYVRRASAWSAVLFASAALDDGALDVAQTASIAKAYVARAAREVAHGAMQVFGGIAFTAEHPAHRFLRRIVVRERQFGDAAHHERLLGRMLAEACGRTLAEAQGRTLAEVSP
jgi:alkylation response protein AidB-like acyl-CoA dehydrogenase